MLTTTQGTYYLNKDEEEENPLEGQLTTTDGAATTYQEPEAAPLPVTSSPQVTSDLGANTMQEAPKEETQQDAFEAAAMDTSLGGSLTTVDGPTYSTADTGADQSWSTDDLTTVDGPTYEVPQSDPPPESDPFEDALLSDQLQTTSEPFEATELPPIYNDPALISDPGELATYDASQFNQPLIGQEPLILDAGEEWNGLSTDDGPTYELPDDDQASGDWSPDDLTTWDGGTIDPTPNYPFILDAGEEWNGISTDDGPTYVVNPDGALTLDAGEEWNNISTNDGPTYEVPEEDPLAQTDPDQLTTVDGTYELPDGPEVVEAGQTSSDGLTTYDADIGEIIQPATDDVMQSSSTDPDQLTTVDGDYELPDDTGSAQTDAGDLVTVDGDFQVVEQEPTVDPLDTEDNGDRPDFNDLPTDDGEDPLDPDNRDDPTTSSDDPGVPDIQTEDWNESWSTFLTNYLRSTGNEDDANEADRIELEQAYREALLSMFDKAALEGNAETEKARALEIARQNMQQGMVDSRAKMGRMGFGASGAMMGVEGDIANKASQAAFDQALAIDRQLQDDIRSNYQIGFDERGNERQFVKDEAFDNAMIEAMEQEAELERQRLAYEMAKDNVTDDEVADATKALKEKNYPEQERNDREAMGDEAYEELLRKVYPASLYQMFQEGKISPMTYAEMIGSDDYLMSIYNKYGKEVLLGWIDPADAQRLGIASYDEAAAALKYAEALDGDLDFG